MKLRALDILLLLIIAIGGVYAWKSGQERSRLRARYNRLASITGDPKITDPARVHIQALETDDPMHFAWRMYYPANYTQLIASRDGVGSSWSSDANEFIGRLRFRMSDQGYLDCYEHFSGGSSRGSVVSGPTAKFLVEHWNELQIEQLGADGLAVIDPKETVTLLQITIPEELQAKATRTLGTPIESHLVPDFFRLKLGPDAEKP